MFLPWAKFVWSDVLAIINGSVCDFCGKLIDVEKGTLFHHCICKTCLEALEKRRICYLKHRHEHPEPILAAFPLVCPRCSHPLGFESEKKKECWVCVRNPLKADKLFTVFFNVGLAQKLLYTYKFKRRPSYANIFSRIIIERLKEQFQSFDVCVPITLNSQELLKRDFCPVMHILGPVMKTLGIPIVPALRRRHLGGHKPQKAQHFLKLREREEATTKRFALNPAYHGSLDGKRILIVDDIYTTGMTINVAVDLLASAHAFKGVSAFTFLRSFLSQGAQSTADTKAFSVREVSAQVMEEHWTFFT